MAYGCSTTFSARLRPTTRRRTGSRPRRPRRKDSARPAHQASPGSDLHVLPSVNRSPQLRPQNFDPIGRWRDKYPGGKSIDASGELPTGDKFADITGLREAISRRKPEFSRFLIDRLLTYSTGRKLTALDKPRIDEIATRAAAKGNGLRDLVELIVLSESFRGPKE